MKAYLWLALLLGGAFALGWSSHMLAVKLDRGGCSAHGGMRHAARLGPRIGTVQYYAGELELSAPQRDAFASLIREATAEVERRDRGVREYLRGVQRRVRELLTPRQRERLDTLVAREWRRYREDSLRRARAWFERETELDPGGLKRVMATLRAFQPEGPSYRWSAPVAAPGEAEERRSRRLERRARRDAALAQLLSPSDLARFLELGTGACGPRRARAGDGPGPCAAEPAEPARARGSARREGGDEE